MGKWESRPEQTIVPQGVDEARKQFQAAKDAGEYPNKIDCWDCNKPVTLQEKPFSYLFGPYDFYVGRIPLYHCDRCDQTHFPNDVIDVIQNIVDQEMTRLNPQIRPNPRAIAFYRQYRKKLISLIEEVKTI